MQQATFTGTQRLFDYRNVSGMAWLRPRHPVLRLGTGAAVVAGRAQVLALLEDPEAFPTPYSDGLAGQFVLGRTGTDHQRHRAAVTTALAPLADDDAVKAVSERAARRLQEGNSSAFCCGRDLIHPVMQEIVTESLGVEWNRENLRRWSDEVFQDIFLNNAGWRATHQRGERAAESMKAQVRDAVQSRWTAGDRPRDVLGRLLAPQDARPALSEPEVVDTLVGLVIGWLWHGTKAALLALDGLLSNDEALELARSRARAGDADGLRRVLWEVLRFRPVQVGLPRVCARTTTLAEGTPSEKDVPGGALVIAGTHAAMWDAAVVPEPHRFDPTRADEQYLIFGHGPHRCLGEQVVRRQLPALLAAILSQPGLRRAAGARGRLRWAGPRPDELCVQFSR